MWRQGERRVTVFGTILSSPFFVLAVGHNTLLPLADSILLHYSCANYETTYTRNSRSHYNITIKMQVLVFHSITRVGSLVWLGVSSRED